MKKNDQKMIAVVAAVIALLGFYFLLLSPQKKAATTAESNLTTAQSNLAQAQQKLSAGKQAQEEFRRDRTTIVKLGRVVPETDDIPTLLTQLQSLADKNHVVFQNYEVSTTGASTTSAAATATTPTTSGGDGSTDATAPLFPPGSVQVSGGLGRTPIEVDLVGTYDDLESYLRAVERFAVIAGQHSSTTGRLMVVDAFSYDMAADNATDKVKNALHVHPRLTATLNASVYFAPPLQAPSAAAASASIGTTPATASTSSTGTATIGSLR